MTRTFDSGTLIPSDDLADVLSLVRQVDPTADEMAVRGYVREIAEANALLDTVHLAHAPLLVSFSPSWSEEPVS
jgi:hypothetical protein